MHFVHSQPLGETQSSDGAAESYEETSAPEKPFPPAYAVLPGLPERAAAIETVVRELVQLVVIDLTVDENAQEIFETLNARRAPLTAADLIKNFIFQKLLEASKNNRKIKNRIIPNGGAVTRPALDKLLAVIRISDGGR